MPDLNTTLWKPAPHSSHEIVETNSHSRLLPLIHMARSINSWEEEHLPIPPTNAGKDLFFRIVLSYTSSESKALKNLYWDSAHASSGIRKTLRHLETTGWLSRQPLPEDMRCRTLVATQKFESLIESYLRMLSDKVSEASTALSSFPSSKYIPYEPWKILIVDDDPDVHDVTYLVLADLKFEGKGLHFLHAHNAVEAAEIFKDHPDISVALIDVVMESEDAGLRLVRKIRDEINNSFVRLILRTGHPGIAPEREIVAEYDIHDYKTKTELSSQRLNTVVTSALRSYRDIITIEQRSQAMARLLSASEAIQSTSSIKEFARVILETAHSLLRAHRPSKTSYNGMVLDSSETGSRILVSSGRFLSCENKMLLESHPELGKHLIGNLPIRVSDNFVVIRVESEYTRSRYQILLETDLNLTSTDLEHLHIFHDKAKTKLDIILLSLHNQSMQERARNMLVKLACQDRVTAEQVESIERYTAHLTEMVLSNKLQPSKSLKTVEIDFVDAAATYSPLPLIKEQIASQGNQSPSELAMRIVSAAKLFEEVSRLSSIDAPLGIDQVLVKLSELFTYHADPDMMISLFLHNQQRSESDRTS
ncbi:Response regulator containing CheY-like receiver, AAA-type ATPase, and DNA-binding domains [Pseudomonas sp. LAMO17WK12:I10]|uniref:DUF3369 domain-containing protein n=1 Tax=unclassified Pseudomonas TaxID=196821 RepID=UPI000BC51F5B|nr:MULTISPECIES: DUF3369 domain-containing protein [unclassified Pseudomonas]PXX51298.1 response regulator receiver domain-containing protein [Pseudomonas sp. LAMO17WK12:I9]SNY53887.1 Response regulator containing CheY-like receiver, AAA-type ATPase, and DNA-binding domains [Pseudomonas sp. LAMO17WK12:I10]